MNLHKKEADLYRNQGVMQADATAFERLIFMREKKNMNAFLLKKKLNKFINANQSFYFLLDIQMNKSFNFGICIKSRCPKIISAIPP